MGHALSGNLRVPVKSRRTHFVGLGALCTLRSPPRQMGDPNVCSVLAPVLTRCSNQLMSAIEHRKPPDPGEVVCGIHIAIMRGDNDECHVHVDVGSSEDAYVLLMRWDDKPQLFGGIGRDELLAVVLEYIKIRVSLALEAVGWGEPF
jgi:hypothetical protein